MAGACTALPADAGLVRQLMGAVDCNVEGLAATGYAQLARPDGLFAPVLTTLLTLYVAFLGYRLLLGRGGLSVGEVTLSALKVGAVLVLATNWAAYQTLVYDLLFHGPQQLAASLLAAVQPEGSAFRGDPFVGLQTAYAVLTDGAALFAGRAGAASPLLGGVAFSAAALNGGALLLLVSTLGTLLISKVVLAVLLALAPAFAGLLLFEATRGVALGWLKAAVATALLPLAATLTLAVELTALEPALVALVKMREPAATVDPSIALQIALLTLVFAGVLAGIALAGAAAAFGLRWPSPLRYREAAAPASATSTVARGETTEVAVPARAARAAAALMALDRRDARVADAPAAASAPGERRIMLDAGRRDAAPAATVALGASYRRAAPRRTTTAARRDASRSPA